MPELKRNWQKRLSYATVSEMFCTLTVTRKTRHLIKKTDYVRSSNYVRFPTFIDAVQQRLGSRALCYSYLQFAAIEFYLAPGSPLNCKCIHIFVVKDNGGTKMADVFAFERCCLFAGSER